MLPQLLQLGAPFPIAARSPRHSVASSRCILGLHLLTAPRLQPRLAPSPIPSGLKQRPNQVYLLAQLGRSLAAETSEGGASRLAFGNHPQQGIRGEIGTPGYASGGAWTWVGAVAAVSSSAPAAEAPQGESPGEPEDHDRQPRVHHHIATTEITIEASTGRRFQI